MYDWVLRLLHVNLLFTTCCLSDFRLGQQLHCRQLDPALSYRKQERGILFK